MQAAIVHELIQLVTSVDSEPLKAGELTDFEEIQSAVARRELLHDQAVGRQWEFYIHDLVTRHHWMLWMMNESGAGLIGSDSSHLGIYLGAIFFDAEPRPEEDRSYFSVQYTLYEKGIERLVEAKPSMDSVIQAELTAAAASLGIELSSHEYEARNGTLTVSGGRALAVQGNETRRLYAV